MCLDSFPIVSRIEFVVSVLWSIVGESNLKNASFPARVLEESTLQLLRREQQQQQSSQASIVGV